jgi:hypothetical protein
VVGIVRKFVAAVIAVALAAPAQGEQLAATEVKAAMLRVEAALTAIGVDVAGYAAGDVPVAELAHPDHPYLQGNDGGYADGRVYVSTQAIEDCRDLTLVHELVHDATVKHRLFAAVPNARIAETLEALADAVTAVAAEDPYRPGCLPGRAIEISTAELSVLANAAP